MLNGLGAKNKKEEKHRPDRIIFSEASSIAVKSIACQAVLLINANTSIPPGEQIRSEQLTALASSLPHGLETANRSAPSLMLLATCTCYSFWSQWSSSDPDVSTSRQACSPPCLIISIWRLAWWHATTHHRMQPNLNRLFKLIIDHFLVGAHPSLLGRIN